MIALLAACEDPEARDVPRVTPVVWATLLDVPEGRAQSEQGLVVSDVMPWEGGLYVGFGAYDEDAGPIPVVRVDAEDAALAVEAVLATEEVHAYAVNDGGLLTTAYDALGEAGRGGVFLRDDGWAESAHVPKAVHVWGAVEWEGALWVAANGFASRSTDGGATWTQMFRPPGTSGNSKAYEIAATDGAVVIAGRDGGTTWAWTFDGVAWTALAGAPSDAFLAPLAAGGATWLVHATGRRRKGPDPLGVYAVEAGVAVPIDPFPGRSIACWTVDHDGGVAVVTAHDAGYRLHVSRDLDAWTDLVRFDLPEHPTAVGLTADAVFVGTTEGTLWRVPVP